MIFFHWPFANTFLTALVFVLSPDVTATHYFEWDLLCDCGELSSRWNQTCDSLRKHQPARGQELCICLRSPQLPGRYSHSSPHSRPSHLPPSSSSSSPGLAVSPAAGRLPRAFLCVRRRLISSEKNAALQPILRRSSSRRRHRSSHPQQPVHPPGRQWGRRRTPNTEPRFSTSSNFWHWLKKK